MIDTQIKKYTVQQHTDRKGYSYATVTNDDNHVRIYTLKNGLKVYLAQNFDAPKIQTFIPVRTGSNNDPADNTGLAHYLEHMMFKGTSKLGSQNWQEEQKLINEIEELYELHKAEENPEKKKEIYRRIDEISHKASQYAIANEYDKVISSLGATGTNAHTWYDETVYKNNIPKNELEKWLKIEKERFSELVLRLFHTELESVYEEFNRAQDNDARLVNYALMDLLFPTHPNGQQTTLGKAEHLKNPSMKAIHQYFETYYVPNNYAMVLVGDLDFDETIQLVDQYFGTFQYKKLPEKKIIVEKPIEKIVKRIVKSPTVPRVQLAWRTDRYGSREAILADIVANILSNKGEAGLLDININQNQKALYATAYSSGLKQYGYFSVVIVPKEEQTLDEGVRMLLEQIDKIKKGDFPDWLLTAMMNDFKVQRLKNWETAEGLASSLYDTYIKDRPWYEEVAELDEYASVTKDEIVRFANNFFRDNYVAVYKEKGVNENLIRVENPGITPVHLNREAQSDFLKEMISEKSKPIAPKFIDYQKEMETGFLGERKISFVRNPYNDLAQLHFIFPFGSDNDQELVLAMQTLQYLGTFKFSPQELREEFYKIGIGYDFKTNSDQFIIAIAGLEENIRKGAELLFHWLGNAHPDQNIYQNFVQTILESREAAKRDKNRIMSAVSDYAKFGADSRFRDVISENRLKSIDVSALTEKMQALLKMPFEIFFYGKDFAEVKSHLNDLLLPVSSNIPEAKIYPEPSTDRKVFFVPYDMVQTEMSRVGRARKVNLDNFGKISVFNEYFGRGLSSVVFQEIRESKSLAYSAYVAYRANPELNHYDYVTSYLGTQPDKLMVAVDTLQELMKELPQIPLQFESARSAALKQIETNRIVRTNIFFNTLNLKKLGLDYDFRKTIYEEIKELDLQKLTDFYNEEIKPVSFNTAIIGKKENLNTKAIEKLGELHELSLEDIFGY